MTHDEFAETIDSIASNYKNKQAAEEEARSRDKEEQQHFLSLFRDKIQNVIKPILEEAERAILTAGLNPRIQSSLTDVTLSTQVGYPPTPFSLSFVSNHDRKRVFVRNDLVQHSDPLLIEMITETWVRKEVSEFLRRVTTRR